ncbi:MAG TPA: alpha/beta hydrolase, partial [Lautropia sp.]|nr:alpha/beta hydrolase [Lautropia sp.]
HPGKANHRAVTSVVLVHGAWVDGSGWFEVYNILTREGYDVTVVQNPLTSLADDVAATRRAIAAAPGPVVLVGHSYGGVVVSESGTDPKVAGVVYIAAFAPDTGESVETLIANPVAGAPSPPILPPRDGFLLLDRAKFPEAFAGDVRSDLASFMAASQLPWGLEAFSGVITRPAWRVKPSWYLVASDDLMIPPAAQQFMANRTGGNIEVVSGSHAIYISKPEVVAALIKTAARGADK